MSIQLLQGDCLELMKELPDGSVDAVVTDPPYGVNVASWDKDIPSQAFLDECLRVSNGAVVWFGAAPPAQHLAFNTFDPIPERIYVWHNTFTRTNSEGAFWQWQPIYVWRKKRFTGMKRDVIAMAAHTGGGKRVHPTQKPVPLMDLLCNAATSCKGATILDPFMGSGTTGVACIKTDRNFIGIEIDEHYCEIAKKRIQEAETGGGK